MKNCEELSSSTNSQQSRQYFIIFSMMIESPWNAAHAKWSVVLPLLSLIYMLYMYIYFPTILQNPNSLHTILSNEVTPNHFHLLHLLLMGILSTTSTHENSLTYGKKKLTNCVSFSSHEYTLIKFEVLI